MSEKTAEVKGKVEGKGVAAKPEKVIVEIVRGQMPAPIVNMIKTADEGVTDGALAAKFRTTNGKVSDIRKGRNFGYIDGTYVPTQEEIDKSVKWAETHGGKEIIDAVAALKPGSEDARKKYDEARAAFRAAAKAAKGEAPAKTDAKAPAGKTEDKSAEKPVKVSKQDIDELTK